MLYDQRVLFSDNGVISDLSLKLNDFRSQTATFAYTAGEDYLYIGSHLPFNHRYLDISTANAVAAEVTVEIWDGRTFNEAVDVVDQTSVAGVSLAQDGYLRWSTDRNKVWLRELDSFDVTGLADTNIPSLFWLRLSWSVSLSGSTALKFVGHKFSKDSYLFGYYPDLNNTGLMAAFASGKSDWEEQHYVAAEQIVRDLRRSNLLETADQVLDYELFLEPSVHKVAELIYSGLGQTYEDKRKAAEDKYNRSLDMGYLRLDQNQNAMLEAGERRTRTGFLTR